MPTFIDESGDTGWKPDSLPFFRLAAVWLPTLAEAEACRESIQAVRKKLGMKADHEFKFARMHDGRDYDANSFTRRCVTSSGL